MLDLHLKLFVVSVVAGTLCSGEMIVDNNEVSQVFENVDRNEEVRLRMPKVRPNVVLILADDMGWGDVGANWPETVDTPNLDHLAMQGLRLTDFHSGASVCAPSRAALLTGRLGLRTGVVRNFGDSALGGIPENETTIAEMLKDAGYRNAMLGKWHLGVRPGHHPLDKGFQSYMGIPYSVDMGCADPPGRNLPQCPACPKGNSECSEDLTYCFEDLALPLFKDRDIIHQPVKLSNLSSMYANFATNFIKNSSLDDAPYFLYAALSHIHVPLAHAHHFENITGRGVFADTLRELDWLVGEILAAVRKHDNNTLVWFSSDNGPWAVKCQLAGSGGPFTGDWQKDLGGGGGGSAAKQTVWEAGHRVPAIVYWPPYIEAGGVSAALISAFDILPTLATAANVNLPPDRNFDGINVLPVIMGFTHQGHHVLFHPNSGAAGPEGDIGAVRIGPYKVVYYSGGSPDCSGRIGPVQRHLTVPLVFHLGADPVERTPLEPTSWEYRNIVGKAREALSSLLDNIKNDNTSSVDYTTRKSARPCCSTSSLICRCPWD